MYMTYIFIYLLHFFIFLLFFMLFYVYNIFYDFFTTEGDLKPLNGVGK